MERRPRKGGRLERRGELELENGQVLYGKEIDQMVPRQDEGEHHPPSEMLTSPETFNVVLPKWKR